MEPIEEKPRMLSLGYNKDCFLIGASWSPYPGWETRTTHIYLGLWVFTIRKAKGQDK